MNSTRLKTCDWVVALWAMIGSMAFAAPDSQPADPAVTSWTKERIDNPPAREIKFEVATTPVKWRLFRAEAKLLEHKYVARVWLKLPAPRPGISLGAVRQDVPGVAPEDVELHALVRFGKRHFTGSQHATDVDSSISKSMKEYLARIPEDRKSKLDELDFFESDDVDLGYLSYPSEHGRRVADLLVFARTRAEAERRATTLVALLDQAVTRPVQQKLLDKHAQLAAQFRKVQAELLAAEADVALLQKKLQEHPDSADLASLRHRQFQLDLERAGVQARLAACDARLQAELSQEQRKRLDKLKLSTEFELKGCEARCAVADKYVEQVAAHNQVAQDWKKTKRLISGFQLNLKNMSRTLDELKLELDDYQPLPLVDGKVILQPVEWTQ